MDHTGICERIGSVCTVYVDAQVCKDILGGEMTQEAEHVENRVMLINIPGLSPPLRWQHHHFRKRPWCDCLMKT